MGTNFEDFKQAVSQRTGTPPVQKSNGQWRGLCPLCESGSGKRANQGHLYFKEDGGGKILAYCQHGQGCKFEDMIEVLDLKGNGSPRSQSLSKEAISQKEDNPETRPCNKKPTYIYLDENGDIRMGVIREEKPDGKDFYQVRPDGEGGWLWGLGDVKPIPYRLPEVTEAVEKNKLVFFCEGEKDTETLRDMGLAATCNPMGAGKWRFEYAQYFIGARVVILADADEAGHAHVKDVASSLAGKAESIKAIKEWPGLEFKESHGPDVTDWVENGGTKEDLLQMVEGAKPVDMEALRKEPEEWPDPIPFSNVDVGPLQADILPGWVKEYVLSLSDFTQTPIDMSLLLSLVAIATAVAGKAEVEVRPGYTEPLILWTVTVLGPANRKSAVFRGVMDPIQTYEARLAEDAEPKRRRALTKKEILEDKLRQVKSKVAKDKGSMEEAHEIADELADLEVPARPRMIVSDITTEAVAQIMAENHGRVASLSPEGDIFKLMAGRYSQQGQTNFENYKKGWTGNEPIQVDRVGRPPVFISNPTVTMGLTVQPAVLRDLTQKEAFKGEGLLGRFLYAMPESPVGSRKTGSEVPVLDQQARETFHQGLKKLLNTVPAIVDEKGDWDPHTLKLSEEALEVHDQFEADIEKELADGGELASMRDWGGKLVGNITRVAALLHVADQVDPVNKTFKGWDTPITGDAMARAVKLGWRLIPHAKAVYDLLDADPEVALARYVLKRLQDAENLKDYQKAYKKNELTKSNLMELVRGKKDIQKPEDLIRPLEILKDCNMVRVVERTSEGPGRPPSPYVKINPKVDRIYQIKQIKPQQQNNKTDRSDRSDPDEDAEEEIDLLGGEFQDEQ